MPPVPSTTTAESLGAAIIHQAVATGTDTWTKIQIAVRIYARGYAQSLIDIARGVVNGNIDGSTASQYAHNSLYLFASAVANMSHIVLHEVQTFINGVLATIRNTINGMLGGLILI